MFNLICFTFLLCPAVLGSAVAQQQTIAGQNAQDHDVQVIIIVTTNRGQSVQDLRRQDFSVLDEGTTRPISSFKAEKADDDGFRYELTFEGANAKAQKDFHRLDVRVDRPNLIVHTQHGYYAQPLFRIRCQLY